MESYSGWGPTDDGRIKPDLVANGSIVTVPTKSSDTSYTSSSGTSFDHSQNTLGVTMFGDNLLLADVTVWSIPFYEGTEISETPPSGMLWSDGYFSFYSSQSIHQGESATTGYWQGIDHGMFGVNFDIDGESHYGWVRLSTGIDDQYSSYILHDWAYETQPGIGITAGTVPEPSTWALFVIGCACLLGRFRYFRIDQ